MNKYEFLLNKFPDIKIFENKIETNNQLREILLYLKNSPELYFDTLFSIVATDFVDYAELVYILVSTFLDETIYLSEKVIDTTDTVTDIYPSAYFDECEIYDMFGIKFRNNQNLKRLLMPNSWQGHPLRKTYQMTDERLIWNE